MSESKIRINLLPPELAVVQKERNKKKWIIRISSAIIALTAILTASVLGFGVIKSEEQQSVARDLDNLRSQIASFNQQEGYLTIIRQKLATINKLNLEDSGKIATLETFLGLIPPNIKITSTTVDTAGQVSFNGQADSLSSFNAMVESFTDEAKNADRVSKVNFSSLSKDSANTYRFDVTLELK